MINLCGDHHRMQHAVSLWWQIALSVRASVQTSIHERFHSRMPEACCTEFCCSRLPEGMRLGQSQIWKASDRCRML
eukprot:2203214-Amphidinium_carterae.1